MVGRSPYASDQPAYCEARQASTGSEALTDTAIGQRPLPTVTLTWPNPPMQISAMRRPASSPPVARIPASTSVAPLSWRRTSRRSRSRWSSSDATRGAALRFTLARTRFEFILGLLRVKLYRESALDLSATSPQLLPRIDRIGPFRMHRAYRRMDRNGAARARNVAAPGGKLKVASDAKRCVGVPDRVGSHLACAAAAHRARQLAGTRPQMSVEQAGRPVGIVKIHGGRGPGIDLEHLASIPTQQEVDAVAADQSCFLDLRLAAVSLR